MTRQIYKPCASVTASFLNTFGPEPCNHGDSKNSTNKDLGICIYFPDSSHYLPLDIEGRNTLVILMAVLLSYISVPFVEKLHPDGALSDALSIVCLIRPALKLEVCSEVRLLWSAQITAVRSASLFIHAVSLYTCA